MTEQEAFMTVVFKTDAASLERNPLHIRSEFGDVFAIRRGNGLAELQQEAERVKKLVEALGIIASNGGASLNYEAIDRISRHALREYEGATQ